MKIFNASRHQRQILVQLRKDIECIFHKGVLKNINVYFENIREEEGVFGLAYEDDKKIQLDVNMNGNRLYNIAAHEISHIFGTNHTSDKDNLMCGTGRQTYFFRSKNAQLAQEKKMVARTIYVHPANQIKKLDKVN